MKVLTGYLVLVASICAIWCAVVFGYLGWVWFTNYNDYEGETGLAVAFFYAPIFSLIGGLAAMAWYIQKSTAND